MKKPMQKSDWLIIALSAVYVAALAGCSRNLPPPPPPDVAATLPPCAITRTCVAQVKPCWYPNCLAAPEPIIGPCPPGLLCARPVDIVAADFEPCVWPRTCAQDVHNPA